MSVMEKFRATGKYSPSLLGGKTNGDGDEFDTAVNKVLDANDLCLASGPSVPDDFKNVLQMASSLDSIHEEDPDAKKAVLVTRRCIILGLVGATPASNPSLGSILQQGYLNAVKQWMDEILHGSVGGIDLLLHLLTNISQLPVTKSVVKESGMGKAIGSIDKHKICVDTPNEAPIKERVLEIKDAWNKSVKVRKEKPQENAASDGKPSLKRELESVQAPSPSAKKSKLDDSKRSSFSSLLKKMAPSSTKSPDKSAADNSKTAANGDSSRKVASQKKQKKRVKWKDHFGGNLTAAKILEDGEPVDADNPADESSVSWSDRRKRDRLREKELLAKAKKSKLSDDDDLDVKVEAPAVVKTILPVVAWHTPSLLPARTDAAPPQVNSREKAAQTTRMTGVTAAKFSSEFSVPNNPTPLSDVEQALDMTSQSSTVTQTIPFFVPQVTAPTPAVQAAIPDMSIASATSVYPVTQAPPASGVASTEIVQSLGLPMFLVGQNIQALQTLASTPSLLSTFVDSNGMYDQVRLMNLVQTLSQGSTPSLTQPTAGFPHHTSPSFGSSPDAYGQTPAGGGIYGPASTDQGAFGTSFTSGGLKNGGYRGAQNSGDGNLHLSGYGPSTSQAEIIALFSPYVQVDEVVMKGTFCFVNTNDPVGAKRAREALNGALLGGQPVRINMAQRKNRDSAPPGADLFNKGAPSDTSAYYGRQHSAPPPSTGFSPAVAAHNPVFGQPPGIPPPGIPPPAQLPVQSQSHIDYSQVRDDRGNPATKNLFVAGYGQGTSEQVLRQIFAPHCEIIGIIMKGTFSFINTSDKGAAVRAREMLSGTLLNGGVLRINFAKETGRLGTSFDLTYGGSSQPRSHYGPRGY